MKKFLKAIFMVIATGVVIVLMFFLSHQAKAQEEIKDTIVFVDNDMSYIVVDGEIYAHGIGNEKDFKAVAYKQSLMIRARPGLKYGTTSNVFLVYGDNTYKQYRYAKLVYVPDNDKEYYDWRSEFQKEIISETTKKQMEEKKEEDAKEMHLSLLKTRAQVIKRMPDELNDVGALNEDMTILLKVVRNDEEYGYMKFLVQNKGSVDFEFDRISFQYMQRYKQKGLFKKKKEKFYEVFPVVYPDVKKVEGKTEQYLVFVIPVFGLAKEKGEYLLVTFREKNGDRKVEIKIDPKVIMSSEKLKN